MQSQFSLVSLVGRYEIQREGLNYRSEDEDMHIISVDPEEKTAFIDFSSSPEWVPITFDEDGSPILDGKFKLDCSKMTYTVL